jgi:hypothetical protein
MAISRLFVSIAIAQVALSGSLFVAVVLSERCKPHPQRTAESPGSEYSPSDSLATIQRENQSAENNNRARQTDDKENSNLSETIAVWVQAIAAVASLGVTIYLLVYAHRGWDAADRNARAAQKSADVARDALVLLNRPFLEIERWDVLPSRRRQDTVDIDMTLRNAGLTQARIEQVVVYTGAAGAEHVHMTITYDTIVNPKQTVQVPRIFGYPADGGSLRVVGRIDYRDTFDARHWKTFGGHLEKTDTGFKFYALIHGLGYNLEDGWGFDPPPFLRRGMEDDPDNRQG